MDRNDCICEYLEYLREVHTDCCDYSLYKCDKRNVIFDEFHDRCIKCQKIHVRNDDKNESG